MIPGTNASSIESVSIPAAAVNPAKNQLPLAGKEEFCFYFWGGRESIRSSRDAFVLVDAVFRSGGRIMILLLATRAHHPRAPCCARPGEATLNWITRVALEPRRGGSSH